VNLGNGGGRERKRADPIRIAVKVADLLQKENESRKMSPNLCTGKNNGWPTSESGSPHERRSYIGEGSMVLEGKEAKKLTPINTPSLKNPAPFWGKGRGRN